MAKHTSSTALRDARAFLPRLSRGMSVYFGAVDGKRVYMNGSWFQITTAAAHRSSHWHEYIVRETSVRWQLVYKIGITSTDDSGWSSRDRFSDLAFCRECQIIIVMSMQTIQ